MASSTAEIANATAAEVRIARGRLTVELTDGRTITTPLAWFPRLLHATAKERASWRLIGRGHGIHWPELDEDISVDNLLAGQRSGESESSLRRWLAQHRKQRPRPARNAKA
jgi:hypothetical protein